MRFFYDSTGKRVGFANGTMLFYYLYNLQGMSLPSSGPPRGRSWLSTATTLRANAPSPTPPATPWATRIPSATGGIITIPRRGFITSTAAIITRSSGGLSARTGSCRAVILQVQPSYFFVRIPPNPDNPDGRLLPHHFLPPSSPFCS